VKSRLGLSKEQSCSDLKNVTLTDSFKKRSCLPNPKCQPSYKYRTSDGSCNNLKIPNLGQSLTTFRRVAPPAYADGISFYHPIYKNGLFFSLFILFFFKPTGIYAPRVSSTGSNLASARLISLIAFNGTSVPQPNFTLAIMQFGQFSVY